jgi:predicted DNA-binding protein (MmcQ/YjbR family)
METDFATKMPPQMGLSYFVNFKSDFPAFFTPTSHCLVYSYKPFKGCYMDIETLRAYCMAKKAVVETFPFGDTTMVFKVAGKMFLLVSLASSPLQFNAKCDPDKVIELREQHDAIQPGYHMNKQHWNTIIIDGRLPNALLRELIDESYELIVQSLPKKAREAFL